MIRMVKIAESYLQKMDIRNSTRNVSWEEDVVQGKGESLGFELRLERRNSRWNGSIAYTLSKTAHRTVKRNDCPCFRLSPLGGKNQGSLPHFWGGLFFIYHLKIYKKLVRFFRNRQKKRHFVCIVKKYRYFCVIKDKKSMIHSLLNYWHWRGFHFKQWDAVVSRAE